MTIQKKTVKAGESENSGSDGETEQSPLDKDRLMVAVLQQNFRKPNLPKNGGHWEDPTKPGNCKFILDPQIYGELMENHHINEIVFSKNEPDFDDFEDPVIGHVSLSHIPMRRDTKEGSFYLAACEVVKNEESIFFGKSPDLVLEYMKAHHLTWHEKADLHTVQAIPADINKAFSHTGAIGYVKQRRRAALTLHNKIGSDYSLIRISKYTKFKSIHVKNPLSK